MAQVAAGADSAHPGGSIVLLMIFAAVLVAQLLLATLPVHLRDVATLHLLTGFLCLPLQLLLVLLLCLRAPLLVLLLLRLHKLLEHMRLLQFVGGDLLLRWEVAQAWVTMLGRVRALLA